MKIGVRITPSYGIFVDYKYFILLAYTRIHVCYLVSCSCALIMLLFLLLMFLIIVFLKLVKYAFEL